jgi:hypothetical protein
MPRYIARNLQAINGIILSKATTGAGGSSHGCWPAVPLCATPLFGAGYLKTEALVQAARSVRHTPLVTNSDGPQAHEQLCSCKSHGYLKGIV